jgi:endonuclease-3
VAEKATNLQLPIEWLTKTTWGKAMKTRLRRDAPRPLAIAEICRRLRQQYGLVELGERRPPLEELIATILSQNTSDRNSDAAFAELRRRFPDWDAVWRAPVAEVVQAIRCAGLARRKAPRIQVILQQIHQERGEWSLDFLCTMPTAAALQYLRSFPGVGPKTAACVLLFACGKPVLPVDTHVHRVSQRLGLITPKINAEQAHVALARITPPAKVLEFHLQLIRHGRTICTARNPRCTECVLLDSCLEGRRRLKVSPNP